MEIKLFGDLDAWVTWKHNRFEEPKTIEGKYNPLEVQGETLCKIAVKNENGDSQSVHFGRSSCSVNDQYCKETGRRISLGRALDKLNVSKSEKKQIFKQYENR